MQIQGPSMRDDLPMTRLIAASYAWFFRLLSACMPTDAATSFGKPSTCFFCFGRRPRPERVVFEGVLVWGARRFLLGAQTQTSPPDADGTLKTENTQRLRPPRRPPNTRLKTNSLRPRSVPRNRKTHLSDHLSPAALIPVMCPGAQRQGQTPSRASCTTISHLSPQTARVSNLTRGGQVITTKPLEGIPSLRSTVGPGCVGFHWARSAREHSACHAGSGSTPGTPRRAAGQSGDAGGGWPPGRSAIPKETELECGRVRALDVTQVAFWFEITFASDQKEQEILSIAVDLHTAATASPAPWNSSWIYPG